MNRRRVILYVILCLIGVICGYVIYLNHTQKPQTDASVVGVDTLVIANAVVTEDTVMPTTTTLPSEPVVEKKRIDLPKAEPGLVRIEDYGDSTGINRGVASFYQQLTHSQNLNRPIRIAVFGDSFIEADILTGDFREMLQKQFGGCGVGFVSITSSTNSYRPTVNHRFNGWQSYAYTDRKKANQNKQKMGLSGYYFETDGFASVQLRGVSKYASKLDTCERVTFYLRNEKPVEMSVKVNGGEATDITLSPSATLQAQSIENKIAAIDFEVQASDSTTTFYGIAMDGKDGVTVDNYSMRGSSGLFLCTVPMSFLEEFNNIRPYDLIILQYGLNVLSNTTTNYTGYERKMIEAIERLKKAFPQSGILLMSIGDRAYKDQNTQEMQTASENINALLNAQRNMARKTGVAFWNVFEVMGGEGGIIRMAHRTPALANKDYTHINFRGGKFIATKLYDAIIDGLKRHNSQQQTQ